MKRVILAAVVSAAALVAPAAQAQVSGQFNVTINLTSACTLSAITDVTFAYTSFQGAAAPAAGGGYTVTCTNNLPYTFGLQAGTGAPVPPGANSINVLDNALNLNYQLTVGAGGNGTGAAQNYNIGGSVLANQGGTCNGATCDNTGATNRTHTLIVDF